MTVAAAPDVPEDRSSSGRPVWSLTGGQLLAELDRLDAESCRIQARRLAVLARLDEIGHAKDIGARDTATLLVRRHRLDHHDIRRDVRLANALSRYSIIREALDDDSDQRLRPRQAEAIVSTLDQAPSTVPVEDLEIAEAEMVKAAQTLSPVDLRRLGRAVLERLDPDGREPSEKAAYDQQTLSLSRTYRDHGVRFKGFLANENAELFQTLIDACSKPHRTFDGQLDPRTRGRRQADALAHILHTAASTGTTQPTAPTASGGPERVDGERVNGERAGGERVVGIPAHGGIRPHIMVTISLDDLIQAGRQHTGDLLFGDRLSASAIRMLACDAGIIPIVLGSNSQPLDVGREFRSVTPAIRTALIARDKGCVICGAPPAWCDAHHIVHWADGGDTSVENTALICKLDHRDTHKGIWTIEVINGAVHVTGPHYRPARPTRSPNEGPSP